MKTDENMLKTINLLSQARSAFEEATKKGLILENDNHIGDIGEYWVRNIMNKTPTLKNTVIRKTLLLILN